MPYSIDTNPTPILSFWESQWTGKVAFDGYAGNSNLSASSACLDAEGYPIVTEVSYTAGASAETKKKVPYTSWSERTSGPAVIVLGEVNAWNTDTYHGPAGLGVSGRLIGDNVYNAVWNDMVDCINVPEDTVLEPGYAYCFDGQNYKKTRSYLDQTFIGIHSDTYGFGTGKAKDNNKQLYAAIAGFVLAYVDKDYLPGTPLTCTENGYLTELKPEDMKKYPYLLIGTFWKPESAEYWGNTTRSIPVNGRKWIRIK